MELRGCDGRGGEGLIEEAAGTLGCWGCLGWWGQAFLFPERCGLDAIGAVEDAVKEGIGAFAGCAWSNRLRGWWQEGGGLWCHCYVCGEGGLLTAGGGWETALGLLRLIEGSWVGGGFVDLVAEGVIGGGIVGKGGVLIGGLDLLCRGAGRAGFGGGDGHVGEVEVLD